MKDLSDVKGTLKGWTEQSAQWYEDASAYTGYHDRLLEQLLRFLKPEDHCCEIACGTGTLAGKILPHVSAYTANDVDPAAAAFLKKKAAGWNAPSLEIVEGLWYEVLAGRRFDVVLTSFYGVPLSLWTQLRSMTARTFLIICPRDGRWEKKRRQQEETGEDPALLIPKLETPEHIREFCAQEGIPYESVPLDLEFGQPFRNRYEAEAYVRYYYRLDEPDLSRFIDEKMNVANRILYFPKMKKIEIFAMDLR